MIQNECLLVTIGGVVYEEGDTIAHGVFDSIVRLITEGANVVSAYISVLTSVCNILCLGINTLAKVLWIRVFHADPDWRIALLCRETEEETRAMLVSREFGIAWSTNVDCARITVIARACTIVLRTRTIQRDDA